MMGAGANKWYQDFDLNRGFILSKKYKSNIYCDQTDSLQTAYI